MTDDDDQTPSRTPLDEFGRRLDRARKEHAPPPEAASGRSSALGVAFRISTEFVAAVVVGGGMGWLFDRWLGTGPWLFLAFLILGIAAAFMNVARLAREMNQPPEAP